MRVTPLYDLDEFDQLIHTWCKKAAGDNYSVRWVQKFEGKNLTSVEPGYKWWDAFDSVMKIFDAKLIKTIFPGISIFLSIFELVNSDYLVIL